jgi:hypothetical protein
MATAQASVDRAPLAHPKRYRWPVSIRTPARLHSRLLRLLILAPMLKVILTSGRAVVLP